MTKTEGLAQLVPGVYIVGSELLVREGGQDRYLPDTTSVRRELATRFAAGFGLTGYSANIELVEDGDEGEEEPE